MIKVNINQRRSLKVIPLREKSNHTILICFNNSYLFHTILTFNLKYLRNTSVERMIRIFGLFSSHVFTTTNILGFSAVSIFNSRLLNMLKSRTLFEI